MTDGLAMTWPDPSTIEIGFAPSWVSEAFFPSLTAEPAAKWIVPKFSSGRTRRPPLGASSTHSDDDKDELYCFVVSYFWPVVLSTILINQVPVDCWAMVTVTESPAATRSETRCDDAGN